MSEIICFLLVPTGLERVSLRRYASDEKCPSRWTYHNAHTHLGDLPSAPEMPPKDDPRWPTKCDHCDYIFKERDNWQVFSPPLYARQDDASALYTLNDPPIGGMWYAPWLKEWGSVHFKARNDQEKGHLILVVPGADGGHHTWDMDQKSSNGDGWVRTGEPPFITAKPSIGVPGRNPGDPWVYHGWLTDGKLTPC